MDDYFTSEMADLIYSPSTYDMCLITDKNYVDKKCHMKGYLMMEIVPHDTADKIF